MTEGFPWYAQVRGIDLLQGDFIDACPILVPSPNFMVMTGGSSARPSVGWQTLDVVVMTQSCDLEQDNVDLVLLCPHWPLARLEEASDFFKSTKGKEDLRRGNVPGYHLIASCELPGLQRELRVVDFRAVYSLPHPYLRHLASERGDRVRLMPPYREHLSQAFARFFMRVGLPVNIPAFRKGG